MGIMTTISVIIIATKFITIIGKGAQGRSELYHILRSKPLATDARRPTTVGRGRGEPTPQGTTGGRGDTMGWGGGEAAPPLQGLWSRMPPLLLVGGVGPSSPRGVVVGVFGVLGLADAFEFRV